MKKRILFGTILMTLFGGLTLTAVGCNETSQKEEVKAEYRLVVDTTNIKKIYYEGEEFDPSGLVVRKVKISADDKGAVTNDYTLSIKAGEKLTLNDTVVKVIPNDKNVEGTEFTIGVTEAIAIKRLAVTKLPNKVEYFVGEKFDSTGIEVAINETINGEIVKTTPTTDFKLSVFENTSLDESYSEIMVISTVNGIKSTSFNITVTQQVVNRTLFEAVDELVKTNNYTVETKIGANNQITGLMTKDALIWKSSNPAYFADHQQGPVGYGDYKGATYRFSQTPDKKGVKDARFISDLGGLAEDNGLFSPDTYDSYGDKRISNYNIQGITPEDLNYLKTEVQAEPDNPNKYKIEISHSKWLFNAVAHTQLCMKPELHLDKGQNSGRIYLEVGADTLKLTLIPPNIFGGVDGCEAIFKNVGKTEIPGLKEFLENPDFGYSTVDTLLTSTQKAINKNNYSISSEKGNVKLDIHEKYLSSTANLDKDSPYANKIKIEYGNVLSLIPGYYPYQIQNGELVVDGETMPVLFDDLGYLRNISLFENISKYFKKVDNTENTYSCILASEHKTVQLLNLFKTLNPSLVNGKELAFTSIQMKINNVDSLSVELKLLKNTETVETITINNFSTVSNDILDAAIENSLYIK